MSDADPLPRGWTTTELGQLIEVLRGVTYKKVDSRLAPKEGLLPLLRATNIGVDLNFDELVYVPWELVKDRQLLRRGDLVVAASSGSASVVGKAARLTEDWTGTFGAFCFAIRPLSRSLAGYVAAYFRTTEYRQTASSLSAGVNINNLKRQHIEKLPIRVAPLPEQHRIVEALDSYLSRLDAAQAALERVQTNLERYRASVLQAAVEGRLVPTEAELAKQDGRDYEPASALLERILIEHRQKWEEAELAKLRAKGKEPKNDRWKTKYKEPVAPDTSTLPDLPEGWCWAAVDQLAGTRESPVLTGPFGTTLSRSDFVETGVRVLTIGCLTRAGIDEDKGVFVSKQKAEALGRYRLCEGDVLFSRMATVGRAGLVIKAHEGSIYNYHIMRLRLATNAIRPQFFIQYARGSSVVSEYVREVNHGVTRDGINTKQLLALPVPLAPFEEQDRIVYESQRLLSTVDQLSVSVGAESRRIGRLRQSILKWAFDGKLVDQDPNDEPASVLLERIRAERDTAAPQKRTRRKKKATA